MMIRRASYSAGSGYIDVIIGISLMMIVFLGIVGILKLSIEVIGNNKAKVGALALAVEQMENLRSLSYNDVGVVGGIPVGDIPTSTNITVNNITYTREVSVRYIDAAADGVGAGDSIPNDYKVAKVTVEWDLRGEPKSVSLVSNIVPKGLEGALPGTGILTVNVIDALGAPLAGADVSLVNTQVSPAISIDTLSDVNGVVSFPGSPTSTSGYEVTVTDSGYSTAQTYTATTSNPNPSPGHLTVVEDTITTATFAIDETATMTVETYRASTTGETYDSLDGTSFISATSNTIVYSGELQLAEKTPGVFYASGSMSSIYVDAPSNIISWGELNWTEAEPGSTSANLQVYYKNTGGTRTIVPDSDLSGNSSGFASGPIDLSGLDVATYDELSIEVQLTTGASAATPDLRDWSIDYVYGPIFEGNIDIDVIGAKTIGSTGGGSSLHKYSDTIQTNASGTNTTGDLEWDTYTFTVDATHNVDVVRNCPLTPYTLDPGEDVTVEFIMSTSTSHSLLVSVTDATTGLTINDATVRLYRTSSGFDKTQSTTRCGQVFWGGVSTGTEGGGDGYSIDVSATGYTTEQRSGTVDISGDSVLEISLST